MTSCRALRHTQTRFSRVVLVFLRRRIDLERDKQNCRTRMMLSYFAVYGTRLVDHLGKGTTRNRFRLGLLPHEIAALNAR
ncbi:hypothetical protein CUV01_14495 [Paracoccus tegillarcae]|uniref:Uncharacterized protein n=1 Tax=Paracoccus tegillarcae TaxID=1529068 RepID=A0A2K9EYN8_9RHOB|nr:hypothetical protein CUV01_14495 [Paracoccus tegillarcae]